MRWRGLLVSALGAATLSAGCVLLSGVGDLSVEEDEAGLGADGARPGVDATAPVDAAKADGAGGDASTSDAAKPDAGKDATTPCSCDGLVTAFDFSAPDKLGLDAVGSNHLTRVVGSPKRSSSTPDGLTGYSIELDGASSVCSQSKLGLDPTQDHTLCWWSQPSALSDKANQLAETCTYDSWTGSGGADYVWTINNCNDATPSSLTIAGVYAVGSWVQICQTYESAERRRTVVVDGKVGEKVTKVDPDPIATSNATWCLGSYEGGGYWRGRIYRPMWFDRILDDGEIADIGSKLCCVP